MVAISLYKGNLHRVPDVPHQWPRPTPKISLKDFKILLRRRARALSRLHSSASHGIASNPNPAPNSNPNNSTPDPRSEDNALNNKNNDDDNNCRPEPQLSLQEDLKEGEEEKEGEEDGMVDEKGEVKGDTVIGGEDALKKLVEKTDALMEEKNEDDAKKEDKTEVQVKKEVERSKTEEATSDKVKRKKEVEEKLEILNEKKHSLVQVLKQILSVEEQLKRQNSTQGMSGRPPLPLQVDTMTDSGSMTRINTPRLGSDGNPCGDMDGGEAEDVSNHNIHSRHLLRMSSTSPSSDSQQRKPASNMTPLTNRTTVGAAVSPSRFAPAGQGQSSVSVSGTSYIASSPSPAASGGTSVFRDGRLPSPWN